MNAAVAAALTMSSANIIPPDNERRMIIAALDALDSLDEPLSVELVQAHLQIEHGVSVSPDIVRECWAEWLRDMA